MLAIICQWFFKIRDGTLLVLLLKILYVSLLKDLPPAKN